MAHSQMLTLVPGQGMLLTLGVAIGCGAATRDSYVPARRATRFDPLVALREE